MGGRYLKSKESDNGKTHTTQNKSLPSRNEPSPTLRELLCENGVRIRRIKWILQYELQKSKATALFTK
jgi:hypothetical protein